MSDDIQQSSQEKVSLKKNNVEVSDEVAGNQSKLSKEPLGNQIDDQIRRQVEFYFSDENLPTDKFLLEQCGGTENTPVSIRRIAGFAKMRKFKPYTRVVNALKESTFLDVKDGKVSRKIPLRVDQLVIATSDLEPGKTTANLDANGKLIQLQPAARNMQSGISKKKLKPTGFEENAPEGPLPPEDFDVDNELYNPAFPMSERMENVIQRFKTKKRMHQIYKAVFDKWMKYGGVEMREQFQSVDSKELAGMDAYEKTRVLATHFVDEDRDDRKMWAVDFVGVAKGFLSSWIHDAIGYDSSERHITIAINVLRTFYNYLLFHNVCPEHVPDILAARAVCDVADKELPALSKIAEFLPGAFNIAASVLFDGAWKHRYVADQSWAQDDSDLSMPWRPSRSFNAVESRIVFHTGVTCMATEEQLGAFYPYDEETGGVYKPTVAATSAVKVGLEVTAIHPATSDVQKFITQHNATYGKKMPLRPCGKLFCKVIPPLGSMGFDSSDRPRDYQDPTAAILTAQQDSEEENIQFWFEEDILEHCFVGMKFDANIRSLSASLSSGLSQLYISDDGDDEDEGKNITAQSQDTNDDKKDKYRKMNKTQDQDQDQKPNIKPVAAQPIWIIDEILELRCSFYTVLANDLCWDRTLMKELRYLPPRPRTSEREARTGQNQEEEEKGDEDLGFGAQEKREAAVERGIDERKVDGKMQKGEVLGSE